MSLSYSAGGVMPLPRYAWDFNGTTTDYVSGLAPTTRTGTITYGSGKYLQSVVFTNTAGSTASNALTYTLSSITSLTNGFTVACWFKINSVPPSGQRSGIWRVPATGTGNGGAYMLYYASGQTNFGYTQTDQVITYVEFSANFGTLTVGTWYHAVYTISGTTQTAYLNGVLKATDSRLTATYTLTNPTMSLGFHAGFGDAFNGEVDDLRIYNTALTAAQVSSIWAQQGVPGRGAVQATPTYNAPLTGASNLNRVYGLQRLTTSYTGNIINIRRSSDNTNVNFTVDSTNTSLVTAPGGQSLASWLGAGTANVVIWYDQSGNGRNLTQLTNGNQPGFSATTGLLYSTGLFMNFPDDMTITDVSFSVGYIQRGYYGPGSSSQWYQQDMIVSGERGGVVNDYGLVIAGSGLFGLGTGSTDGAASTIATNGTGVYSFMTCTRNSTTGQVLLYNGTGSGTSFTKNTGTLSGPNPTSMGKLTYASSGFINADVSSFFMFDSVKSQTEIASIASKFVNSTFTASPVRLTGTPLFTQLSTSATSSAVGAFSLRAVNGLSPSGTARAVQVRPVAAFPPAVMSSNGPQNLSGYPFGGGGSYTASASSSYFAQLPWQLFAGFYPGADGTKCWAISSSAYDGTSGTYTGGVYTTNSIAGEWVQIQLPVAVTIQSLAMYARGSGSGNKPLAEPKVFYIFGSNDGTTWTQIYTTTVASSPTAGQLQQFSINTSAAYAYIRFVINAIFPGVGAGNGYAEIGQLTYFGTPANSTTDFYADRLGNLLTAPVTGQTLASWLAGGTGYVTTWYDQSGRGNNATQATAANQPKIDLVNKQIDFKPSAYFDLPNGTVPFGNSNYTMIVKHNTINTTWAGIIGSGTYGTQNATNAIETNTTYTNYWWSNDMSGGAYAQGSIISAKYDNTIGRTLYVNGTSVATNANKNRNSTNIQNTIGTDLRGNQGQGGGNRYLNGELYYVFLFGTALSDTDRTLVESLPVN